MSASGLSESARALATLLANLPGMAYRCANDPDWTELFVSEGCLELTGYRPVDLQDNSLLSFNDLVHADDRQWVYDETQRALTERRPYRFPYRIVTATSEVKWVWDQGTGVYGPEGELLFLEGFIMDISEKIRAEEALREREEQLRQSQKMEALGQLAGGVAHDFNNLLTAILGYSEMILSDGEAEAWLLKEYAGEIKRAAERAGTLTRQILAFSRRQALEPSSVSLNAVVTEMEPLLRRTLGKDVDLVTLLHPEPGLTEVDKHQFEQVLMNLAVNARDAMPLGGQLTIETAGVELDETYCQSHLDARPGSYVLCCVSDSGIGMDRETQTRVFEPFFTTKPPGSGTGLGLSIVYGIVKQSGGSINVYSEPDRGTTFKVYLPRIERMCPTRPLSTPASPTARGKETILVVEDEESIRGLVTRILKGLGYTVSTVSAADEAVAFMEADGQSIDLLLTDVVLPGGTQGTDLAEILTSRRPDLPVLFMSGYTRNAMVKAGRLEDEADYLEKPFTPRQLASKVREVLDTSKDSVLTTPASPAP